jgi:hypothetical protein
MRISALAPKFQPDDPRLDDHAAHPIARPTPFGCQLQSIGRRLSPTDATASPLPGPAPCAAARSLLTSSAAPAAHRRRRETIAFRHRHGLHHLRDKRAWPPRRSVATIANFPGAGSKVGRVVGHAQELALATRQHKLKFKQLASWR